MKELSIHDIQFNKQLKDRLKLINQLKLIEFSNSNQLKCIQFDISSSQTWFDVTLQLFNIDSVGLGRIECLNRDQLIVKWLIFHLENDQHIENLSLNKINKLVQTVVPWLASIIQSTIENNTNTLNGIQELKLLKKFLGDRIRCLELMIIGWGLPCVKFQNEIVTCITSVIRGIQSQAQELGSNSVYLLRYCINTLGSFCHRQGAKLDTALIDQIVESILTTTLGYIQTTISTLPNLDNPLDVGNSLGGRFALDKFVKSSLRALYPATKFKKSLTTRDFELVLTLSHQCSFWGIVTPNQWRSQLIQNHSKLINIRSNYIEFNEFLKNSNNQSIQWTGNSESDWLTSSSDRSVGLKSSQLHEEIRCSAYKLMRLIFEKRKDTIVHYWRELLPTNRFKTDFSLAFTLIHDPAPSVQVLAIEFLEWILAQSSKYLNLAISNRGSSFTSFSESIGSQIEILHSGLVDFIDMLDQGGLKNGTFKCLKILLTQCSYTKLKVDLLGDLFQVCTKWIEDDMADICVFGWDTMLLILNAEASIDFKRDQFASKTIFNDTNAPLTLLDFGIKSIVSKSVPTSVKIAICKLIPVWIGLGWIPWHTIQPIITELMDYMDPQLRAEAFRMIYPLLEASGSDGVSYLQSLNDSIFDQFLPLAAGDADPHVKSAAAELMSYYPMEVFEALETPIKIYAITLLLGWAHDDNYQVQADCFKTLGVWIAFPTLLQNEALILDLIQLCIDAATHPHLLVRVKSSWCLANVCDQLVELRNSPHHHSLTLIHSDTDRWNDVVQNMINCGIGLCSDQDKIKGNGVRILGRVAKIASSNFLSSNAPWLHDVMRTLFNCFIAGLVKTRWNAILSIGQLYQHPQFVPTTSSSPWHFELIDKMQQILISSHNYKFKAHILQTFNFILPFVDEGYLLWSLRTLTQLVNMLKLNKSGVSPGERGHWNGMVDQIEECHQLIDQLITTQTYGNLIQMKRSNQFNSSSEPNELIELIEGLKLN